MKTILSNSSSSGAMSKSSVRTFLILSLVQLFLFINPNISESTTWTTLDTDSFKGTLKAIQFLNENTGYAIGGDFRRLILKTTNGGTTWQSQTSLHDRPLINLHFLNVNTGYVVGKSSAILRTLNGGLTWQVQASSVSDDILCVGFADENTGFFVNSSGFIYKTTDGGNIWDFLSFVGFAINSMSVIDTNIVTLVGESGTIRRTTDGGNTWPSQTMSPITNLQSVSFINSDTGIAVGYDGVIIKTTNGGTNWINLPSGTNRNLRDVSFIDEDNAVAVGDTGTILRTLNGGSFWFMQESNTNINLHGVSFLNTNIGFTAGGFWTGTDSSSIVLKTINGSIKLIDVGVTSIFNLVDGKIISSTGTDVLALIRNFGVNTLTNINVYCQLNDNTPIGPVLIPGPLPSGVTTPVLFSNANAVTSNEELDFATLRVYVQYPGDIFVDNDTNSVMVFVRDPVTSYPYLSDFSEFPSPYSNPNNFFLWQLFWSEIDPTGEISDVGLANFFSVMPGVQEMMRTTIFDLTGITNPVLSFYRAYTTSLTVPKNDQLEIVVSTDGGVTWSTPVYSRGFNSTPSLATIPPTDDPYFPMGSDDWVHTMVSLLPYAGQEIVVGFNAISDGGNNLWLDNVKITDPNVVIFYTVTGPGTYGSLDTNGMQVIINTLRPGRGTQNISPDGFEAVLSLSRVDDFPLNNTFAMNDSATTFNDSIFTPNIVANRYWEVAYSGDDWNSTANYDVILDISGQLGIVDPDQIYILKRVDQNSPWVCHSTVTEYEMGVAVRLIASGLQGFSQFSIGAQDGTLPVDLVEFSATIVDNDVMLNWKTSWEENNLRFDVQRRNVLIDSEVGTSNWQRVGSVQGSGTVYEERNYTYTDKNLLTGKYEYRLIQIDLNGNSTADHQLGTVVEIGVPSRFELSQNYPNPFNPVTKINFQLPVDDFVTLKVFDVTGREVATLVNENVKAGYHTIEFNGTNFASGVYIYRLVTPRASEVKKMLMIK